jgi:hypothetical protein
MTIEDVHEDADPGERRVAHLKLGGRWRLDNHLHDTIGRADHQSLARRRHPRRIPEEIDAPHRQNPTDDEERCPEQAKKHRRHGKYPDERVSCPMDRRQYRFQCLT